MGSDHFKKMDQYSLLDILTNSDFKISVKPQEVAKNIASYLNSKGASVNLYKNCPVNNAANTLCKKYRAKKLSKEKFMEKERDWLSKISFSPFIMSVHHVSVPAEEPCLSTSPPLTLPSVPEDTMLPSLSDSTDSYAEISPWVEMMTKEMINLSTNDMFKDALIYCMDGMISFPRAMVALIYPSFYSLLCEREEDTITLLMPQSRQSEVMNRIQIFFTRSSTDVSGYQQWQDCLQPTGKEQKNILLLLLLLIPLLWFYLKILFCVSNVK